MKNRNEIASPDTERSNKIREAIERLRRELKEIVSTSVLVIDMKHRNLEPEPPAGGRADIMVVAITKEADYTRELLGTEPDFSIIEEGSSPVLNHEDRAFYLRLNDAQA